MTNKFFCPVCGKQDIGKYQHCGIKPMIIDEYMIDSQSWIPQYKNGYLGFQNRISSKLIKINAYGKMIFQD